MCFKYIIILCLNCANKCSQIVLEYRMSKLDRAHVFCNNKHLLNYQSLKLQSTYYVYFLVSLQTALQWTRTTSKIARL